jgi:hypothetical protein
MRAVLLILSAAFFLTFCHQKKMAFKGNVYNESCVSIPVNGNSWYISHSYKDISPNESYAKLDKDTLRTYFSIRQSGKVSIAIVVKSNRDEPIDAIFGNIKRTVNIKASSLDTIVIDTFAIRNIGYNHLDLINPSNTEGIQVSNIIVKGDFEKPKINFVRDEFYWGKRGPSVHLLYSTEENIDSIKWFYNEVTVPNGNDVEGSFFMPIGFGEGYFGIQVNSKHERRILFSVWSPYKTDNPKEIPQNQRIKLLKKGKAVHVGEFGAEGSGGQSYLKYMWKADVTYKFLLKGEPVINNQTDYTAYFYSPIENNWVLIASFRRPQISTYLKHFHSFLENFQPEQGKYSRKGIFSNQWICNKDGLWVEINKASLSADNTARKGSRLDFAGGVINGQFFLKHCGFFNESVDIGSKFTRPFTNKSPDIEFQSLP